MKLIMCPHCTDLFNLSTARLRKCSCGKSWGQYKGALKATYGGDAIPVGISNNSLLEALNNRTGPNPSFEELSFNAFFVRPTSPNFTHEASDI